MQSNSESPSSVRLSCVYSRTCWKCSVPAGGSLRSSAHFKKNKQTKIWLVGSDHRMRSFSFFPQSVAASGPRAVPQTSVEFDRQVLSVFAEELVVVVVDGPQRGEVSGLHAGEEVLPPATLQLH